MAIEVPKEQKVYTTVYDSFKGVDFTNDPTNVYRRRSPDGVNMLPDLDGRPFKRTGWEVVISECDFIDAAYDKGGPDRDSANAVKPIRTYYFELNGHDTLFIINSAGEFMYSEGVLTCVRPYYTEGGDDETIDSSTPPPRSLSPNKGFFFEGNGEAGFYIFAKDINHNNALYRYKYFPPEGTSPGVCKWERVEPKIPLVLTQCDPDGVGNALEGINMLTRQRTVGYTCDGTSREFIVPGGYSTTVVDASLPFPQNYGHKVEILSSSGVWEEVYGSTYFESTQPTGKIKFKSDHIPQEHSRGEDNMKFTYTPDGYGGGTTFSTAYSGIGTIGITESIYYALNPSTGQWVEKDRERTIGAASNIPLDSPKMASWAVQIEQVYRSDTWADDSTTTPLVTMDSSGGASTVIAVTAKSELFDSSIVGLTKTTETVKGNYKTVTCKKWYRVRIRYVKATYSSGKANDDDFNNAVNAFANATRCTVFGNGIYNQVFIAGSTSPNYKSRLWYSGANDPTYFPELNYIEVGASDTEIVGMVKVDNYLGVVKSGSGLDASIYLAYPTSFMDMTTYAVKQGVNGLGALARGAFNILKTEPMYLSKEGVCAIDNTSEGYIVHNRSYFLNQKLCAEQDLENAYSFIYDGMYWLAIGKNGHCYILDGSQKTSWANEKTNLQYEAYYLENVPAQCFVKYEGELWFADYNGNMCRFKDKDDLHAYRDGYIVDFDNVDYFPNPDEASVRTGGLVWCSELIEGYDRTTIPKIGEIARIRADDDGRIVAKDYTIIEVVLDDDSSDNDYVTVSEGVPITAVWSTIADDDGAVHFFKNLKKKGSMVSLLPSSDSGVQIYLKPDRKDPIFVCESDAKQTDIPFDVYMKKKIKKYKRLQIICKNSTLDDAFGVDQIIKCYTMGNYSKNRG